MPKLDGKGPKGKGPKTGRKLGECEETTDNDKLQKLGKGMGKSRKSGCGEGKGKRLRSGEID
ncbi:MAG: hypothetical protein CVT98_07550 [Bacteroidetes bacterium HGW-Bacteroidetes-15]|nr:MAG: hypothetical protein CVT98_07550 [Bacteroidetes bacterium HGW-Bacteroidetes-15]